MAVMNTVEDSRRYHPQFKSPDADLILVSSENTSYRVLSSTLRKNCDLLHDLPASNQVTEIDIDEKDTILAKLLCLIYGLPTDPWESIEQLEDTLELALNWNALEPMSVIRSSITMPMFLADPLRVYAISTRFGWAEQARLASTHTLSLNLYDNEHKPKLERIASKHLMALLRLHRFRRNELKRLLDTEPAFRRGNTAGVHCGPSCSEVLDNHAWRELKVRMFVEMDRRPRGDTLVGSEMEAWPEAIMCWSAKCQKASCSQISYDKRALVCEIKKCIDSLPVHI